MMFRAPPLSVAGIFLVGIVDVWLVAVIVTNIGSQAARVIEAPARSSISASLYGIAERRSIESYRATLTRPIFFKTREPFVAPPAPPPPAPSVAAPPPVVDPGFVLAGVLMSSGVKKAYLFTRSNASGTWAAEGGDLMGWRVQSVSKDGAKLEQQGRVIDLKLYPRD
jgi:hypothetical protein